MQPFPRPEKADSAAEPEDASAQQAQDESSKVKDNAEACNTKTTATQKAKRG
ncbi:terminase [Escherichia coli]|nr:terminase [Escherichia coli]